MQKEWTDAAIILARMYGVAETLNPLPCRSQTEVVELITGWAAEYIEFKETDKETDILPFFERKIKEL